MPAFPPRTDLVDTYPAPNVAKLKAGLGSLWDAVTGLLGTTGTKAAARATLGVEAAEVDVASAATCDIGAAESMNVRITGTAGISSFGTAAAGVRRWVRFGGVLTITNGASLAIQGGSNITTAAGDSGEAVSLGGGSWTYSHYPAAGAAGAAPAGSIMFFAASSAPAGYLKANGAAVSRVTYAALFAVIGTTYGTGDGSTTFNLPDLRGEFVRGLDDGRGIDSGRTIGSHQDDALKAHTHDVASSAGGSSGTFGKLAGATNAAVSGSTGGTETRPRNVALLVCIKY